MVDSTRGIGPIQGIPSGDRTQNARNDRRTEGTRDNTPVDEVEISQAALDASDVAAAESRAEDTRAQLAQDQDATLSNGSQFDGLV